MKKTKLKKLLDKWETIESGVDDTFADVEKELASVSARLKESINVKTVEKANEQFKKIQALLEPVIPLVAKIREDIEARHTELKSELSSKIEERSKNLLRITNSTQSATSARVTALSDEIQTLQRDLDVLSKRKIEIPDFASQIKALSRNLNGAIESIQDNIGTYITTKEVSEMFKDLEESLIRVRSELRSKGGGSPNRQIKIDGTDYLTRYTDINLIGGSGVSISAANNDTAKRVDITLSVSGVGSSVYTPAEAPNGSRTEFTVPSEPKIVFVDGGRAVQEVSSDSTVNWTYSGTTLTMTLAPNFDIFALI